MQFFKIGGIMDYHGQAQFQFRQRQAINYDINSQPFSTHLLTPNPSHTLKIHF